MSRSNPVEFSLAAMKGGKRPPKPKAKKVKKKKVSPRHLLGSGLAGQAMDALMRRKKKQDEMTDK